MNHSRKTCARCERSLETSCFTRKPSGQMRAWCQECERKPGRPRVAGSRAPEYGPETAGACGCCGKEPPIRACVLVTFADAQLLLCSACRAPLRWSDPARVVMLGATLARLGVVE